jgi:hypothetical protein
MAKFVMVVQSSAKDGRDADYNAWYDEIHMADILAIPGVISGRRFEATPVMMGPPGQPYLSIFEIEADDPAVVMGEMGRRAMAGEIRQSDALDAEASALWFYKDRTAG